MLQNSMSSDVSSGEQTSLQQSGTTITAQQYKAFQLAVIEALQDGKDTIVVQPTGSVKSLCYIASTLMVQNSSVAIFFHVTPYY